MKIISKHSVGDWIKPVVCGKNLKYYVCEIQTVTCSTGTQVFCACRPYLFQKECTGDKVQDSWYPAKSMENSSGFVKFNECEVIKTEKPVIKINEKE